MPMTLATTDRSPRVSIRARGALVRTDAPEPSLAFSSVSPAEIYTESQTCTQLGIFSQDPIGFAAGDANLYRYVGNGPVGKTDTLGLIDDYDLFKDLVERWGGGGGIVEIHHIFHQQFYKDSSKLGAWLNAHGFAKNSADNLVPLVGRNAPHWLATRFGRSLHLGRHLGGAVRAVQIRLEEIHRLEAQGLIDAVEARARISAIQNSERQMIRSGARMLHASTTVSRHIASLAMRAATSVSGGALIDVALGAQTVQAAEPQPYYPPLSDHDVLLVTIFVELLNEIAVPPTGVGPYYVDRITAKLREVQVNAFLYRNQAEFLDGLEGSTEYSGEFGKVRLRSRFKVFVHDTLSP